VKHVIAVVTGASTGIGAAVAKMLVKSGHTVVAVARDGDQLAALGRALGDQLVARPCDVTDTTAFVALLNGVVRDFGRVDLLVNNAGTAKVMTIAETTPAEFRAMHELNVTAPAVAIHTLWPTFVRQGGARIVNVSSLAQLDPFPGFFAYASSKSALHLLSVVADAEGKPHDVRAFTVAPGVVDTPLHRTLMPEGIPPVDGLASALQPIDVARVICAIADGSHDERSGWVLAMPAPAAVTTLRRWIIEHPGGGVEIVS
jgi:NAD(P)-dependent dehydrogenase (short-subunit alcohol dehydrogenase family)